MTVTLKPDPDSGHITTKEAGKVVTTIAGLLALAVLLSLTTQLVMLEQKVKMPSTALEVIARCETINCTDTTLMAALEQDAQSLRSDRVRRSINARLMIFVVAELVALTLIALGGVLIFDRVESRSPGEVRLSWLRVVSVFPGVILCLFGAAVLCVAIQTASDPKSRTTVWDYPVFLTDPNAARNLGGGTTGHAPGSIAWIQAEKAALQEQTESLMDRVSKATTWEENQ